jgi:hypothetical protein
MARSSRLRETAARKIKNSLITKELAMTGITGNAVVRFVFQQEETVKEKKEWITPKLTVHGPVEQITGDRCKKDPSLADNQGLGNHWDKPDCS